MLVTFKTSAHAHVTMFGDIAKDLLKMMGQSGNVPGALVADDVAGALEALRKEIVVKANQESHHRLEPDEHHAPITVALSVRAKPLIDLLESAVEDNGTVVWESN